MARAAAMTTAGGVEQLVVATWALPESTSGPVNQPASVGSRRGLRPMPMTRPYGAMPNSHGHHRPGPGEQVRAA